MAEILHIQPWEMGKLTPWEHDAYVARTNAELKARQEAHRASQLRRRG